MGNKSRIEKCIIRTGTESLRATAGTETLITSAARNGGMREWVMGGESM